MSCAHKLTCLAPCRPLRKLYSTLNYLIYGSHHCEHCKHLLSLLQLSTAGRKRLGLTHYNVTPFNASFDRRIPGRPYSDVENLDVVCRSRIRSDFRLCDFLVLLLKLATEATVKTDSRGLLSPTPVTPVKLSEWEKKMLRKWAEDEMDARWRKSGKRAGILTVDDLYEDEAHRTIWAAVIAADSSSTSASASSAPSASSSSFSPAAAWPAFKFSMKRNYVHAHTTKKAAEAHFREHKEELRAALKTLDAKDISTTAFYSEHAVTHVIFTLLEDDMDRPGWLRIFERPRAQRDMALHKFAYLAPDHGTIMATDLFDKDHLEEMREESKAATAKIKARGGLKSNGAALKYSQRKVLVQRCGDASIREHGTYSKSLAS